MMYMYRNEVYRSKITYRIYQDCPWTLLDDFCPQCLGPLSFITSPTTAF